MTRTSLGWFLRNTVGLESKFDMPCSLYDLARTYKPGNKIKKLNSVTIQLRNDAMSTEYVKPIKANTDMLKKQGLAIFDITIPVWVNVSNSAFI